MNRFLFLVICIGVPYTALAQRPMSFDELAQLALSGNRELQAARESLRQAQARLTQAGLRPNPTLDVSGSTDAVFAGEGDNTLSVMVSQSFELGGKRAKRINVERASLELAKAQIANSERDLRGRLRALFVDAKGASLKLEMFDRVEKLNQQTVTVMDIRVRSGDASRLDSQLLQAQTNQTRAQRVSVQSRLTVLLLQIKAVAGIGLDDPLALADYTAEELSLSEQTAVSQALESRPDLKAARLREAAEEAGVLLAQSQSIPNASVSIGYGRESLPISTVGSSQLSFERDNVLQFGVLIPLPFFNREQGNIAEASSRRSQARIERETLELNIRREVVTAYRRYQAARQTMDLLQSGVLKPNQDSSQIVQLAYRLGDLRLLDVIAQERLVIDAESNFIDAQNERTAALSDLILAIGK